MKAVAQDDEDRNRAAEILNFLDRSETAATPNAPPVIRRRERPRFEVTETVQENKRASFSGRFVELQCSSPAKIVLETDQARKVLMIDDPTRLMVNGKNGEDSGAILRAAEAVGCPH